MARVLLLYNQFPYDYRNIGEMAEDLSRIASMGFNAVWINPIQKTETEMHSVSWLVGDYTGSLYAMNDPDRIDEAFRVSPDEEENTRALRAYTDCARANHLVPIFDLVLNQVAHNSVLFKRHPHWFRPSMHFGPGCLDFNYDNGVIEAEIMTFWKGYIDKYIGIYGFMGVRVDAVKHVPARVQCILYEHIRQRCREKHGREVEPIIFAELLLSPTEAKKGRLTRVIKELQDLGVTHITHIINTAYWDVALDSDMDKTRRFFHDMGTRSLLAPTVGFAGSHDEKTLYGHVLRGYVSSLMPSSAEEEGMSGEDRVHNIMRSYLYGNYGPAREILEVRMKKSLARVAFGSNGGWYLQSGDEFGAPGVCDEHLFVRGMDRLPDHGCRKLVFRVDDRFRVRELSQRHWDGVYDLTTFVRLINKVYRDYLSEVSHWVELLEVASIPSIIGFVRHPREGFEGEAKLILVNIMERREELDLGMTKRLIGESGLQAPTKSFLLGRLTDGDSLVFLVGNFSKQDDIRAVVVSLSDESSTSALDTSRGGMTMDRT